MVILDGKCQQKNLVEIRLHVSSKEFVKMLGLENIFIYSNRIYLSDDLLYK